MTQTIMVIHGMRHGKQNQILGDFVNELMAGHKSTIHLSFLESNTQHLERVMTNLIHEGHQTFQIIPLLLFSAQHYCDDIPNILNDIKQTYPQIEYRMAQPLATHQWMASIMIDHIMQVFKRVTQVDRIIFIGHGSSVYDMPNIELNQLMQACDVFDKPMHMMMVYGDYHFKHLIQPFLLMNESILIVPVFLYDGFLVNKVKYEIAHMQSSSKVHYAEAINFDPKLSKIIEDRIQEIEVLRNVSYST